MPVVDFAKFGAIETKPLSRIKKISGANLHRNWVTIPHVTQYDEADITEMEAFRKQLGAEYAKQNIKITPLAFMLKAVVAALQQYPDFNASLDASGENLVLKQYFHIGVAVDTPDGLMVPVLRDVDKKGIVQLAKELGEISARAGRRRSPPPTCRAAASRSPASAASAARPSRPSSTRRKWRSWACRGRA